MHHSSLRHWRCRWYCFDGGNSGTVEGAKVTASVVEHFRGKKLYSFKKKRRKGYRRKIGHRQELTKIQVDAITA